MGPPSLKLESPPQRLGLWLLHARLRVGPQQRICLGEEGTEPFLQAVLLAADTST